MRTSLSMVHAAHGDGTELCGIVLVARFGGSEQELQDLRIGFGGPSRYEIEQQKHQQPSEKASEEIERAGADAHGEEEKPPFGAQDGEGARERAMYEVDASGVHGCSPADKQLAGEKPRKEIDSRDGHAHAEQHTGK